MIAPRLAGPASQWSLIGEPSEVAELAGQGEALT